MRVKCEDEWNYDYFLSVKFVVLTADQFVGRDNDPLKQQKHPMASFVKEMAHFF